jgi:hypothetical protein
LIYKYGYFDIDLNLIKKVLKFAIINCLTLFFQKIVNKSEIVLKFIKPKRAIRILSQSFIDDISYLFISNWILLLDIGRIRFGYLYGIFKRYI